MKLRCYLLSLLRIHHPDCKHCNLRETCGEAMRKRLEELNWRTQPNFFKNEVHGEVVEVFDSEPGEFEASPQISLAEQAKKAKKAVSVRQTQTKLLRQIALQFVNARFFLLVFSPFCCQKRIGMETLFSEAIFSSEASLTIRAAIP